MRKLVLPLMVLSLMPVQTSGAKKKAQEIVQLEVVKMMQQAFHHQVYEVWIIDKDGNRSHDLIRGETKLSLGATRRCSTVTRTN
jgi:hypothetical protein